MAHQLEARAIALLRQLTGDPDAEFREGQLEAISQLVLQRRRVLCVQRTGWGKSAVYFIATQLLREEGCGPSLLISPLLALMRNQVLAADRIGIAARTINSSNTEDWDPIFDDVDEDAVDLLLISPERLNNPSFRTEILPTFIDRVGLLIVDEAHCISDWGHDFRPDYRRIALILRELPTDVAVLCTTATANDRVVADIESQLGEGRAALLTIRGSLDRPALRLETLDLPTPAERLAWLTTHLEALPGSGIVYCLTVRDTRLVADWLRGRGFEVAEYSGESDQELRPIIERRLLDNDLKAVVATSALGMGYDKPDLGFVVHFQSPGSPIAYYQQVGRAGRKLDQAHAILLRGGEDREIQDYFINVAFPSRLKVEEVLGAIAAAGEPLGLAAIEREVNIPRGRLEALLKILEVEGAVERRGGRWVGTDNDWTYDEQRVETVTAVRQQEQAAMFTYAQGERCLMEFLREQLDDPEAEACGRCAVCTEPRFADAGGRDLAQQALDFLRHQPVRIEPRKQWAGERQGRISSERRAQQGRALSRYMDAGFGSLVARGKWEDVHFADELVVAGAELIGKWAPAPAPEWVTAVPSRVRPELVPGFGRRLSAALGLPFVEVVRKTRDTAPQKEMENSAQQADNLARAFAVDGDEVRGGPVLLVDDMCDSGWTMTVVADALLEAGSGPVYPFALADTGRRPG